MPPRSTLQRLLLLGLGALALSSIAAWLLTTRPLPAVLRIATAAPGGQYHVFAAELAGRLEQATGRRVELIGTPGSAENARLLRAGEVELGIVQAAGTDLEGLAVLAPLYLEAVTFVVRRGLPVTGVAQVAGRSFALGPEGSGMRGSARRVLGHYRIGLEEVREDRRYFLELLEDERLDGALVTTGIDNPDLARLLASGEFDVLPLLDAEAIALRDPMFEVLDVPRGLFHERPPVPPQRTRTVATTALLTTSSPADERLIGAVLDALYTGEEASRYPMRIASEEALERSPVPLHPAVRRYLDPFGPLNRWQALIEGLAGLKELLVGLAALALLAWQRVRQLRQGRRLRELAAQKERLDGFLERTIAIERRVQGELEQAALRGALTEVSRLKLEALEELTHEDLRGDGLFLIFLQQCADLAARIEWRLAGARTGTA